MYSLALFITRLLYSSLFHGIFLLSSSLYYAISLAKYFYIFHKMHNTAMTILNSINFIITLGGIFTSMRYIKQKYDHSRESSEDYEDVYTRFEGGEAV